MHHQLIYKTFLNVTFFDLGALYHLSSLGNFLKFIASELGKGLIILSFYERGADENEGLLVISASE